MDCSRATDDCIDLANGKVGDIKIVSVAEVRQSMRQESSDGFVVRQAIDTNIAIFLALTAHLHTAETLQAFTACYKGETLPH